MFRTNHSLRRVSLLLFLILVAGLVMSGIALASGGHDEGGGNASLIDLGKRFLNFALLVVILGLVLKKVGIKEYFTDRTKEISQKLEDLEREKETAENQFREAESKIREFEGKRQEIIEQFKADGAAEKEKIISEARERVKSIIAQAEVTIQQEIESARGRLKEEILGVASLKAQEIISKEMTEKDQDHLVNDFIERVGKIH